MSRRAVLAGFVLAAGALVGGGSGCGHTHTATDTSAADKDKDKAAAHPETSHAAHTGAGEKSDGAPVSASPAGLLAPGGAEKIQARLSARGLLDESAAKRGALDGPTEKALRRFQRDADLPVTGAPDDETVRRLGLDPAQIFRAGHDDHR